MDLAISTTEAEYVFAKKACQQALWMKQALIDYDIRLDDVPIMSDNKGAIDLSLEPFLTLNEPICPRFEVKFYHSLEVKRDEEERPYIEFKLGQFTFKMGTVLQGKFLLLPWQEKSSKCMYCIHALLLNHQKKVQLPFDAYLSNEAIVPFARFTFHECVIDPLDISRNPSKEKGNKIASPSVTSSSSSLFDDNEAPSFLKFYDELSDNEDITPPFLTYSSGS
ncbi:hypothetical protein Tco_1005243 [Tanacetum coccineum]|uniref:Retrovirus-related Pol polyprotein from transposon TNT 1-94 n=1 Tax=Tanacetum coccineum TaxID=301880 RepID=A0ABQ5FFG4_9ASTR